MEKKAIPFVLALYALVFAIGVGLSVTLYRDSAILNEDTVKYLDNGIAMYAGIAALRGHIATQESILYEYYATTGSPVFKTRWEDNQRAIDDSWAVLSNQFGRYPRTDVVTQVIAEIRSLSGALERTLNDVPIDWDRAREILEQVTEKSLIASTSLSTLSDDLQQRMHEYRNQVENRIGMVNTSARYYIGAILVIAVLAGLFLSAYLSGVRERQRLAMFVEKNPNPVLRLTRTGDVEYVNPGAWATLMALGVPAEAPLSLLPQDVRERVRNLTAQSSDWAHWQYTVLGRDYEANVHWLRDFKVFHVYLRDISERVRAERRLEHMAFHDPVTDLPNRRRFLSDIQTSLELGEQGAVLLIGIERTQRIIDSMGHGIADRLYQILSRRLTEIVADFGGGYVTAHVYRYEGEIFGVSLTNPATSGTASQLAMDIVTRFGDPLLVDQYELFLGASIGCCHYPADGQDAISLISRADQALQQVKGGGGGFHAYASGLSAAARERLSLENHLRHALERGELSLAYQPQVAFADGAVAGVEALLRWEHPVFGSLPPGKFIPLAEETGLIQPIGEWILRTACHQAKAWRDGGMPWIRIAVNLSARQFITRDIIKTISDALNHSGLPPQYLEVEITETLAMQDVPHSIEMLRDLKALGVCIALDDFGTGYSSLAYLRQLPLDRLKIDRSFVCNIEQDAGDALLVRSIIDLGHNLGLKVIAEGIESQNQYDFLNRIGCDEAQGFLFCRPIRGAEVESFIGQQGDTSGKRMPIRLSS